MEPQPAIATSTPSVYQRERKRATELHSAAAS
jgi:hypothetical protein